MVFEDSTYIKEQSSSCFVIKSLLLTCITEWLAWETSSKDIKWGYIFSLYLLYITFWYFSKICPIGFLCEFIIIGRKNTLHIVVFHCKAETSNTTKQVNSFVFLF